MEIQIRTYDETSSERVSIGVPSGQKIEIQLVAPDEIRPGTEEGLRDRIADLQATIKNQAQNIESLTAELEEQTRHLSRVTAELKTCREERSKRFTLAEVEDAKTAVRNHEGARIRSEIRGLLSRPGVEEGLATAPDMSLAVVIHQIRELLDN